MAQFALYLLTTTKAARYVVRRIWDHRLPPLAIALSLLIALAPITPALAQNQVATGTINGTVVSAETGEILDGVVVRVLDMDRAEYIAQTVTAEDGSWQIDNLPRGRLLQVSVVAPEGYVTGAGPS